MKLITENISWNITQKQPSGNLRAILANSQAVKSESGSIDSESVEGKFLVCGSGKTSVGCGRLIQVEAFLDNHSVCPECGHAYILGAGGWIDCLTDAGSFRELDHDLNAEELLGKEQITDYYRDFLGRQKGNSYFSESLATGIAEVKNSHAVMAVSEFYYCGGSMGVAFGEKFSRAVDFAIRENLPLVSLCCSGGARLYEGILALMQMVKAIEAVNRLKRRGLPFISILANPSTGGAIASYAALGDVVIAEPNALISFTGPRVMRSRGFEVDPKLIKSQYLHEISADTYKNTEYYHDIRGIQEICDRANMRSCLARYMELYKDI